MKNFQVLRIICLTFACGLFVVSNQVIKIDDFSYGAINEKPLFHATNKPTTPSPAKLTSALNEPRSIVFTGDILLARNVEYLMNKSGQEYPFQGINFNDWSYQPFVVGNFEATVPEQHKPTRSGAMRFSVDTKNIATLKDAGFTHFSLANNHSLDYGQKGIINTIKVFSDANIETFGLPGPQREEAVSFIEVSNKRVALIAIEALTWAPTQVELDNLLHYASRRSDLQFVYIHWGTEYKIKNDRTQKTIAKRLVAAGADMIVGHHPHVVQNIDLIDGVPVFYSLGNYVFDQYFSPDVQIGLVLNIEFSDSLLVRLLPVTSQKTPSQPNYMEDDNHINFLSDLAAKSHPDLSDFIKRGTIPLDTQVATSSKIAIMNK